MTNYNLFFNVTVIYLFNEKCEFHFCGSLDSIHKRVYLDVFQKSYTALLSINFPFQLSFYVPNHYRYLFAITCFPFNFFVSSFYSSFSVFHQWHRLFLPSTAATQNILVSNKISISCCSRWLRVLHDVWTCACFWWIRKIRLLNSRNRTAACQWTCPHKGPSSNYETRVSQYCLLVQIFWYWRPFPYA